MSLRSPAAPSIDRAFGPTKTLLIIIGVLASLAAALTGCSRTLGTVQGLVATPLSTSLSLSWQAVPHASAYDVFISTSSNVSPSNYQITTATAGTAETFTGLTAGTTYYCVVLATSSYGFNEGPYSDVIAVTVGGSGTSSNPAPIISALTVWPEPVPASTNALFVASASDSDGDTLTYAWTVDGASLSATTNQVFWPAPAAAGTHTVTVSVSDGVNPAVTSQTTFNVQVQ